MTDNKNKINENDVSPIPSLNEELDPFLQPGPTRCAC